MFKGKTALVTGGSRGIGRAIAIKLSALGANIAVNYNNSAEAAEKIVEDILKSGGKAVAIKANVSNFNEAKDLIDTVVKEFGSIDILVNNAGITKDNLILRMNEENFDAVIETNLKGCFNCTKHASRYMLKKKSGRIINMASVIALVGNPGQSNYAASKAGIIGLTKSVAKELASRKITVNAIAPGFIVSDMTDKLSEEQKSAIKANIPMGEFGTAEDVAELVAFLASDNAKYITGQVINVDGGMAM